MFRSVLMFDDKQLVFFCIISFKMDLGASFQHQLILLFFQWLFNKQDFSRCTTMAVQCYS